MDDKAYSETHSSNENTPVDPPSGALIVTATGTTDANKFTDCYFEVTGTGSTATWVLKNKGGQQIDSGTGTPSSMNFNHDKKKSNPNQDISWTLSNCVWTPNNSNTAITEISGSWVDSDDEITAGPQGGSFTASSDSDIDAVSASASASAK